MALDRIFFKQERVGRGGKPLVISKFKTMLDGERDNGEDALQARFRGECPDADHVTLLGALLRYLRADEFPQIWNWLRGELNLVSIRVRPRDEFDLLPPDLQAFYQNHGPGLFPVEHLNNGRSEQIENMRYFMLRVLELDLDRAGIWQRAMFTLGCVAQIYWNSLKSRPHLDVLKARFLGK